MKLKYFDVEDDDEHRGVESHDGVGLVQLDRVEWSLPQCLSHQVQDQGEILQWALSQWPGTVSLLNGNLPNYRVTTDYSNFK